MTMFKTGFSYLIILSILLPGAEVSLRIYAMFPQDTTLFIVDDDIGYRARPNMPILKQLTTNDGGFNDINHSTEPMQGANRLAIIGDSFVYGAVARDKNFTFVLSDLAHENSVELEVLNMGITAAGPKNYLGIMQHDVVHSNADLVAVSLFVGNDIMQSHPHFKTSLWLNSTREVLAEPYYFGLSWEYSYLYRSVRSVSRIVRERLDKTKRGSFSQETFMAIEQQRSLIYKKNMDGFVRASFDGVIDLLVEMSQDAKRQSKQFFVVLAPDEIQISSTIQNYLKLHYGLDPSKYDFKQPQSILVKALNDRGIKVLDLLPFFLDAKKENDLYLKYDTHWDDAGNRLAAEAMWQYIEESNLLGP